MCGVVVEEVVAGLLVGDVVGTGQEGAQVPAGNHQERRGELQKLLLMLRKMNQILE